MAMRTKPLPASRKLEVELGVIYLALEGSDGGSKTRVCRPLRLSRDRHLNSTLEANCSCLPEIACSSSGTLGLTIEGSLLKEANLSSGKKVCL